MTTTIDKPRRRAPGGGRKPIGDKPFEAAIYIRLDAAVRDLAAWKSVLTALKNETLGNL